MHLGDEVEIVSDRFASVGAARGAIGVVTDDWADGSVDVEVSDPRTGQSVATFRAAHDEVRPYAGQSTQREPREHGILFGRGDELDPDVEAPPMSGGWGTIQIPGYTPAPIAFSTPPQEDAELSDDIPWELREEPPSGPIFH